MSETAAIPPLAPPRLPPPSVEKTLRKLFLTLFLRGRSSRGLKKSTAPTSVWKKLGLVLVIYAVFGTFAARAVMTQPLFAMSVYLHALTFVFLGMFVASSAGEILFNKEEGDILLHRPIAPRTLLWAKIRVMVEVSLYLAGALNLAGLICGAFTPDGAWLFPVAHAASGIMEALFCAGSIVLVYQLCLRWFGRERLEGLMTAAQMLVAIGAVIGGQVVPRLMFRPNGGVITFSSKSWWIGLLPPAWFAGFDDAIAGSHATSSLALASVALAATAVVLWLAFGKLARDYETGLQAIGETVSKRRPARGRRLLDRLAHLPPLTWLLREPVSRASFLLTTAYLTRDRDVKLRIYPGLAPMMVMPFIFLFQPTFMGSSGFGSFGISFASVYLGILPMMGMSMLQYTQQWQASDVFRAAPMAGPRRLCDGARLAVLCILAVPPLIVFAGVCVVMHGFGRDLLLLLPGVIALPIYALIPCLGGGGVPLSLPTEEAKSVSRGLLTLPAMFVSMAVAGIATWAWSAGWFWWFLPVETVVVVVIYAGLRAAVANARWQPID